MPIPRSGSRPLRTVLIAALLIPLAASSFAQTEADELVALKSATDRWIQLRSQHAKEAAEWRLDRSVLQDSIATLQASKENLRKDLAYFADEKQKLDAETAAAQAALAQLESLDATLTELVQSYETRLLALSQTLPPPLQERLRPLLAKIPGAASSAEANLPSRLQNLVATLTVIDEFNNNLTLTRAIREMEEGDAIEVRVLYFGLATAFATNASGTRAWTVSPDDGTWRWKPADADAPAIAQLFQVYEKAIDPVVVQAPFSLKQQEAAQ